MQKTTLFLIFLLLSSTALSQADSLPNFRFGNGIQGSSGLENGYVNAVQAFEKMQERADAHYKAERYEQAFDIYHELAKHNDKFSQYRIAFMFANGRGIDKNMVRAYAWSYVSTETRQKGFINYHVAIRDTLSETELEEGRELATRFREYFGTFAVASNARKLVRKERRSCTGSRVGSSCDRVSSSGISCSAAADQVPGKDCLTLGSVGLPGVAGMLPNDLRTVENQLEEIMEQHNPGRVELGDFEVIEDD